MPKDPDLEALIFTTNNAPDDKEAAIHDLVRETREEADQLIWEVQQAESILTDLKNRRDQNAARIRILQGSLSALRRFPPEVLSEIFWHSNEGRVVVPPLRGSCPWKLGHVCSYWRKVLWCTRCVWSDISLRTAPGKKKSETWQSIMKEALSMVLSSSGTLGTISAILRQGGILDVEDLIRTFSCKFRNITLDNPPCELYLSIQQLPAGSFGSLESLKVIGLHSDTWLAHSSCTTSSFQHATKLREVTIVSRGELSPFFLLLPFAQLTTLRIHESRLHQTTAHNVLSQCISLVDCKVTVFREASMTAPHSLIALPHLLSFGLALWDCSSSLERFLEPFVLPSLKKLEVDEPIHSSAYWSYQPFLNLIRRSNCALDTFTIENANHVPISDPELRPLLHALTSVTSLKLDAIIPPCVFLMVQGGDLLPRLRLLSITVECEGLQGLLDWLECDYGEDCAYPYKQCIEQINILCIEGPGYHDKRRRLQSQEKIYNSVGLKVVLSQLCVYSD